MLEKLACNMESNDEKPNIEFAKQLAIEEKSCPCKRTKCVRHGNCEECIAHHKEKETKYEPYCMRKSSKKKMK